MSKALNWNYKCGSFSSSCASRRDHKTQLLGRRRDSLEFIGNYRTRGRSKLIRLSQRRILLYGSRLKNISYRLRRWISFESLL